MCGGNYEEPSKGYDAGVKEAANQTLGRATNYGPEHYGVPVTEHATVPVLAAAIRITLAVANSGTVPSEETYQGMVEAADTLRKAFGYPVYTPVGQR